MMVRGWNYYTHSQGMLEEDGKTRELIPMSLSISPTYYPSPDP